MHIHPTAIISRKVTLGQNVSVGPFALLEGDIEIGDGTTIAERVSITGSTRIGKSNIIRAGAVIGSPPQDKSHNGFRTGVRIGDGNDIREYVTINAATGEDGAETIVGDNNYFMAYSHVGHNCVLGDHVVMANDVNLGGYVTVGDRAYLGGQASVHQFVRIGELAMVSGYSKTIQDAPPFMTVVGQPTRVAGLNTVGLDRAGYGREDKRLLKKALRLLFRSSLSYATAIQRIREELEDTPCLRTLIDFMQTTQRGVCRGRKQGRSQE